MIDYEKRLDKLMLEVDSPATKKARAAGLEPAGYGNWRKKGDPKRHIVAHSSHDGKELIYNPVVPDKPKGSKSAPNKSPHGNLPAVQHKSAHGNLPAVHGAHPKGQQGVHPPAPHGQHPAAHGQIPPAQGQHPVHGQIPPHGQHPAQAGMAPMPPAPDDGSKAGPIWFKDEVDVKAEKKKQEKEHKKLPSKVPHGQEAEFAKQIIREIPADKLTEGHRIVLRIAEAKKVQERLEFKKEDAKKENDERIDKIKKFTKIRDDLKRDSKKNNGATFKVDGKSLNLEQARKIVKDLQAAAGVGAGSPASRSGECVTVSSLMEIRSIEKKSGESNDDYEHRIDHHLDTVIRNRLMAISNSSGSILSEGWVEAGISATKKILSEIGGAQNLEEVSWDTPEGRHLCDTDKHGTSSDMFIKTKSGKRYGISLKKDGAVFLNNSGLGSIIEDISDSFKEAGVAEDKIEKFNKNCGYKAFDADFNKVIGGIKNDYASHHQKFMHELAKAKKDPKFQKTLGSNWKKYVTRAEDPQFFKKTWIGEDEKAFSKVLSGMAESSEQVNKELQNLRAVDTRATKRIMESIQDPEIARGMNNHILEAIHFGQILGIDKNDKLDNFMTVYGIQPHGAVLSKETLSDLFSQYMPDFGELTKKAQKGDKVAKQKLLDGVGKQFIFDGLDAARGGLIKIKVKNTDPPPPTAFYPLFQLGVRSRGLGAAPSFELSQHNFLANILESGVDIKTWPKQKRANFYKAQVKTLQASLRRNGHNSSDAPLVKKEIEELTQRLLKMAPKPNPHR